jgi:transposase InsO family protein
MALDWYAERYRLRQLRQQHPDWSQVKLAQELGHSYSWVKKWLKRLAQSAPDDNQVLRGRSRAPKHPRPAIAPEVVKEILTIRDEPPGGLQRIPGPETIKYYLHQNQALKEAGAYLPSSTSTIWRILAENGRILRPNQPEYTPLTRNPAMQVWEMDFKDVTSVQLEPSQKRMHLVESLNIVDTGSSMLVDNQPRADYNAETVIDSLVQTWRWYGLPQQMRFDRDPRFIGSWSADDFPAPLMRLMLNLGIDVEVCPPRQPWQNPYVERFNRTYKYEGIFIYQPQTLEQTEDMNRDVKYHYNYQRPNQALTCHNQPPAVAFANLPSLPQLPDIIDPDHWLKSVDQQLYKRRVNADGTVQLGKQRYYIQRKLHKQAVSLKIDAANRQIQVLLEDELIKSMPLKGLHDGPMPFERYVALIKAEAVSEWRRYKQKARYYLRLVA